MLRDLTLGQYLPMDSVIHRLDPRTKLCVTLLVMLILMVISDLRVYPIVFLWLSGVVWLADLPFALVLRNVRAFVWLLLITFAAHAWFTPGEPVEADALAWLGITREGLLQGLLFTVRVVAILLVAAVLTLTTAPIELADGLEALLKPFTRIRVPAHELAMIMVIALRFVPTLVEETDRLQKAQMARGADFTGHLARRARKMMSLLIPLMVSAFRRADDLAVAMEARCYQGGTGRTRFRELCLTRDDYAAIILTGGLITGCWLLTT